jgi:uncharacterized protein YegL
MRRLPIYLVLDCSGSMRGEPIRALNEGIQAMQTALKRNPYALETAYLSVITFGGEVKQVVPLTEVIQFRLSELNAGGGTPFGATLRLVTECVNNEVVKNTPEEKGDWKPIAFIMSDGRSSDGVKKAIRAFRTIHWGNVIACAAGKNPNLDVLHRCADVVVRIESLNAGSISEFFKWVSSSIAMSSRNTDESGNDSNTNELPPVPPCISLVQRMDTN